MSPAAHLCNLAALGRGWHCYALEAAQRLEQEDPDQRGVVASVEEIIGSELRRTRKWLERFADDESNVFEIPAGYFRAPASVKARKA